MVFSVEQLSELFAEVGLDFVDLFAVAGVDGDEFDAVVGGMAGFLDNAAGFEEIDAIGDERQLGVEDAHEVGELDAC